MKLISVLKEKLKGLKYFFNGLYFKLFSKDEVYYIGGNESLPPPLTGEEEKELIEKLRLGDESIRSTLIERNLRLVV